MAIKSLSRSTINQSFRNNSALAGYEPNHFYHLETVRLGGNAASVSFTNLSRYSDFQHLQLRVIGRTNRASVNDNIWLTFNSDSGNNYIGSQFLLGNGSSVSTSSVGGSGYTYIELYRLAGANSAANAFGTSIVDIYDAFDQTKRKTIKAMSGLSGEVLFQTAIWAITNTPLTSLNLSSTSGNLFISGTRFSLYGWKVS
jgi:hypothetical protein